MANDYFVEGFTGQPRGIAKTEQVQASLKRVEAGSTSCRLSARCWKTGLRRSPRPHRTGLHTPSR